MNGRTHFAIVTGASTGIGRELAKRCAVHHFDLLIAADEPEIENAAEELRGFGVHVDAVQADLATTEGVDRLIAAKPVCTAVSPAMRSISRRWSPSHGPEKTGVETSRQLFSWCLASRWSMCSRVQRQHGRIAAAEAMAAAPTATAADFRKQSNPHVVRHA